MASAWNGVYRTPGRSPDGGRFPRSSWRTLVAPLAWTSAYVFFSVSLILLFKAWIVPTFILTDQTGPQRIVPTFDFVETGAALLRLASLVLLVGLIVWRVRPAWRGLGRMSTIAYVVALVLAQSAVVVAAEYVLFKSRGGLHLFEAPLEKTFASPDGRTAFLYREGLGCGFDVHVAEQYSLLMTKTLHVSRKSCDAPLPAIQWKADRTIDLVDATTGAHLESEVGTGVGFGAWGGGC